MKIYIDNYNIANLSKKLKGLNKYLTNKTNTVNVYSDEGIFSVDQQNIYKVTYLDKPIKKMKYISENNIVFDMIIDSTEITSTLVNQLPSDNVIMKTETQVYQISANSKIKLVVILTHVNKVANEYIPNDFYFDVSDDIDIKSPMFKEDINVFLFHLN
jgi:hypothetical protein